MKLAEALIRCSEGFRRFSTADADDKKKAVKLNDMHNWNASSILLKIRDLILVGVSLIMGCELQRRALKSGKELYETF